jgi:uncharacterized membrane protein HdeD (DUF308 family)
MKLIVLVAILLVVLGVIALIIPSITFFSQERVADVGFFTVDISKPHTIVFNPIMGIIALAVGVVLLLLGLRSA